MTTIIKSAAPENTTSNQNSSEAGKTNETTVHDFNARKKALDFEKAKQRVLRAGSSFNW